MLEVWLKIDDFAAVLLTLLMLEARRLHRYVPADLSAVGVSDLC